MRTLIVLVLVGLFLSVPTSAIAQESGHLAVSQDGRTWSPSLNGSVLDDAPAKWAPGDRATGAFWVRNDGPTPASLSVGLEPGHESAAGRALLDALAFHASVDSTSRDLAPGQEATGLAVLRPGQSTKVSLAVAFNPESLNVTQSGSTPIRVQVRLTDTAADVVSAPPSGGTGSDPAVSTAGSTSGELPATGASVDAWWTWAAFAAIGVGSIFLAGASGRRRRTS